LFGVICKEVEAKKDQVCAQLIVRKADDEKRAEAEYIARSARDPKQDIVFRTSNLICPVPMLVDWEYAQLADPVYDLLSGLAAARWELLGAAGITDANATVRLVMRSCSIA
jgi:hypothetical protein